MAFQENLIQFLYRKALRSHFINMQQGHTRHIDEQHKNTNQQNSKHITNSHYSSDNPFAKNINQQQPTTLFNQQKTRTTSHKEQKLQDSQNKVRLSALMMKKQQISHKSYHHQNSIFEGNKEEQGTPVLINYTNRHHIPVTTQNKPNAPSLNSSITNEIISMEQRSRSNKQLIRSQYQKTIKGYLEKPLLQSLRSEEQNLKHQLFQELIRSKCQFINSQSTPKRKQSEEGFNMGEEDDGLQIVQKMKENKRKRRLLEADSKERKSQNDHTKVKGGSNITEYIDKNLYKNQMITKLQRTNKSIMESLTELQGNQRRSSISVGDAELIDYAQVVYQQKQQKMKQEQDKYRKQIQSLQKEVLKLGYYEL